MKKESYNKTIHRPLCPKCDNEMFHEEGHGGGIRHTCIGCGYEIYGVITDYSCSICNELRGKMKSRIESIARYVNSHIEDYLAGLICKQGGVYQISDGHSYMSLLTSNEAEAKKQFDYLFCNRKISRSIIEKAVYRLAEEAMLEDISLIPDTETANEAVTDFILEPLISLYQK